MNRYPDAADAIVNRHYMDEYFKSTETVKDALQKASEVQCTHSTESFEIRNWVLNATEVLQQLGESTMNTIFHFNTDMGHGK